MQLLVVMRSECMGQRGMFTERDVDQLITAGAQGVSACVWVDWCAGVSVCIVV